MGYKLKTNSGAKKRFKLRPGGKVSRKQRGVRHNAGSKTAQAEAPPARAQGLEAARREEGQGAVPVPPVGGEGLRRA